MDKQDTCTLKRRKQLQSHFSTLLRHTSTHSLTHSFTHSLTHARTYSRPLLGWRKRAEPQRRLRGVGEWVHREWPRGGSRTNTQRRSNQWERTGPWLVGQTDGWMDGRTDTGGGRHKQRIIIVIIFSFSGGTKRVNYGQMVLIDQVTRYKIMEFGSEMWMSLFFLYIFFY